MKKLVCMMICFCLLAALAGCGPAGPAGPAQTEPTAAAAPGEETPPPVAPRNVEIRLMLPANQTGLAAILETLAKAEGYSLRIETGASGAGYADTLNDALADGGPDLFWLEGEFQTRDWDPDSPPAADLLQQESSLTRALAGMVAPGQRLLDDEAVYGLPVGLYAEGSLVNIELLGDLLGTTDHKALLRDLVAADFEEWQNLALSISAFLEHPEKIEVTLGGNTYVTPRYRPESAKALRGVFAVGTGEARAYFQNTLAAVYGAGFASPEDLLAAGSEQRAALLREPLAAAYDLFMLETQYMTQESGRYSRGEDYPNHKRLTMNQASDLFTAGTALFLKGSTSQGLEMEQQYPDLKGCLALIPTKLPIEVEQEPQEAGVEEEREPLKIYQSFAYAPAGYLCLNEGAANPEAAQALLLRLFTSEEGQERIGGQLYLLPFNSYYPREGLNRQLAQALADQNCYPIPAPPQLLESQQVRLGEWVQVELMLKPEPEEADEEAAEEAKAADREAFLAAATGYIQAVTEEEAEQAEEESA